MNTRFFTGYLPADADEAWAPATSTTPAQPRLLFDVMVKDSRGVEFPEKCVVDDPALMKECRPYLTAGRGVVIQGEGTARPFIKDKVLKGWTREVRVQRIEFPARGGKKVEPQAAVAA